MTEADNKQTSLARRSEPAVLAPAVPPDFGGAAPAGSPGPGVVQVLWRRKLIVLMTILASLLAGAGYLYWATPIYSSSARIYVQQSGPKIMAGDTTDSRQSGNYLNTECQVIGSGPILAQALRTVQDLRTFVGNESPLSVLALNLKVAPGKSDDLITVSFESPFPEDAAAVVNAVVEAYKDNQSTSKKDSAEAVLKILEPEKGKDEDLLKTARDALLNFKQKHPELGFQGEKGNIIVQRLDRLSTAVTDAEIELAEAKSAFEAVDGVKDDPAKLQQFFDAKRAMNGTYVPAQDEDVQLHNELNSLKVQLQGLRDSYPGNHPNAQRLETRIKELQKLIADRDASLAESQLAAIQQHYDAATKKLASVKAAYDEQMQSALGLNRVAADYERLQNDCERLAKLVETLDGRIKELQVNQKAGALNISVLERAGTQAKPSKPNRLQVGGIAVAGGILLGLGLALLRNWMDPRLTSADEVAGLLGVPVVGVLPRIKGKPDLLLLGRNVLDSPVSPIAEAYRGIRTALNFGFHGAHAKTILVTSPAPGDGKSSLVSNLAITMAQAGQRTLVVDADLLSPRQHAIFGIKNDRGLAGVLSGEVTLEQAIHLDGNHGPDILPSGRILSHTSELLNGRAFVDLIRRLSETYDQILIDSPPLMSVTDPLVLAAVSDVTVLVLRAERSHRRMAEQAREGLMSVGARVFGAVVNDVKGSTARYGGYYRYYQGRQDYKADAPNAAPEAEPSKRAEAEKA